MSRIFLGSDHAGYEMKEVIKRHLAEQGRTAEDLGCHDTTSVDYPDFALAVARAVAGDRGDRGILVCGTGIGMAIAANKVRGIRAALCHDGHEAKMSRNHNNANVVCVGGRVIGDAVALEIVDTFLREEFEGGRHARRVDKIAAAECGS